MEDVMQSLSRLFKPASVAVIGASEVPGKAAERRTRSLIKGGYPGKIFLINPKRDTLFGRKAYPSLLDIGEDVDLVVVIVAPKMITQAVADSVKMHAKGIVIITAGLGETGEEGKKIEAEILRTATEGGAKIIGPNCNGLFSASGEMNLIGVPPIKKGPLAVIAQSGNIIDSITHYAEMRGVGLSHIISAGNAIGVQFHEYIDYLGQDEATQVILMYMEGIKEGGEIVRVAREVSKRKPIVILKVGRSKAGARAAASHTGSLAADDAVVDAAFRQAGIVRVTNVDEMFDVAMSFANMPLPKGNRVAIVSEGGGTLQPGRCHNQVGTVLIAQHELTPQRCGGSAVSRDCLLLEVGLIGSQLGGRRHTGVGALGHDLNVLPTVVSTAGGEIIPTLNRDGKFLDTLSVSPDGVIRISEASPTVLDMPLDHSLVRVGRYHPTSEVLPHPRPLSVEEEAIDNLSTHAEVVPDE